MVQITLTAAFVAFSAAVASAQISLPISLGSIPAACSGDCAGLSAAATSPNCLQETTCYCAGGFIGSALPCLHCVKAAEPSVFGAASPNDLVQGIVVKCAGVSVPTTSATSSVASTVSGTSSTGTSTGTSTVTGTTTSTVTTTSSDKTTSSTSSSKTSSSSSSASSSGASATPSNGAIAVSQNVFAVLAAVGLGSVVLL